MGKPVLRQLGQCPGGPQLRHQARGVPGGAAGELAALQQQHIADSQPGEVVGAILGSFLGCAKSTVAIKTKVSESGVFIVFVVLVLLFLQSPCRILSASPGFSQEMLIQGTFLIFSPILHRSCHILWLPGLSSSSHGQNLPIPCQRECGSGRR